MVDDKYVWGAWMATCTLALNLPVMYWVNDVTARGVFVGPLPFNHLWVLGWVLATIAGLLGMWQTMGKRGDAVIEANIEAVVAEYGRRHGSEEG